MAEVESYLLARQPCVLESSVARGLRGSLYVGAICLPLAVIDFARANYLWGIFFLLFGVLPFLRNWKQWREVKPVAAAATASQCPSRQAEFPSDETLLARTSEQNRRLLNVPAPRRVRLLTRRASVCLGHIVIPAMILGLLVWSVIYEAGRAKIPWPASAIAILMGTAMVVFASLLLQPPPSLRKWRRLLATGQAAPGLVVLRIEEMVWYDYRDVTGRVHPCADFDYAFALNAGPAAGSVVVVFYDPENPERCVAYPCSPFEFAPSPVS